ncbi:MAG: flagellar filament capping protein FliD [Pseudomonadales bacterium]|nr:flagellar filament capping protein FliD [Pseudomonadales bacterium]
MASIQSLGIGSGLLTSDLVDKIIGAEREATDLRLDARKAEIEARISSYGSVRSIVSEVSSAVSALSSSSGLLVNTAASSIPTSVTATASAKAAPGIHTVDVTSLARKQTLTSIRFDDIDAVVGDGILNIRFGTTTLDVDGNYDTFTENEERAAVSISIPPGSQTLAGVRDAINKNGNGITANIVQDGEGYVLVLASDRAGADNSLEITVSEGFTPGLSSLAFNAGASTPGTNLTQAVAADDARVTIDGLAITRETNTISDVVTGVTFNLLSATESTASISIARDDTAISTRVQDFVDSFNSLKSVVDELTKFDDKTKTGALLMGDATVRGLRTQMRRLLTASIGGLDSSSIRALVDIGVRTDQNNGFQLTFDSVKLTSALASNAQSVVDLLADSSSANDPFVKVIGFQKTTAAGDYAVNVSQLATHGLLTGAVTNGLQNPIVVDDDNDGLSLKIDGLAVDVTLTQGSYADGTELAAEIQKQINAASILASAGLGVVVDYDDTNHQLTITSNSFGSVSSVAVTGVDTNTGTAFGISIDDGAATKGVDVAGTINGITATGYGQFLSVPIGPVPATPGIYRGDAITGFDSPPLHVGPTDGTFSLNVDGTTSNSIQVSEGDYATPQELVAELQAQIDADAALGAANVSVTVSYNTATTSFEFTSGAAGANSRVDVLAVDAGVPAALGLVVGTGTAGKNPSTLADPAGGLQIQVTGGELGDRGNASVIRGVMSQFNSYLSDVLSFSGSLQNRVGTLQDQLTGIEGERKDFNERMGLLETRLRTQFAAADALISKLNSTSSFLDSQLKTLPGYSNSSN